LGCASCLQRLAGHHPDGLWYLDGFGHMRLPLMLGSILFFLFFPLLLLLCRVKTKTSRRPPKAALSGHITMHIALHIKRSCPDTPLPRLRADTTRRHDTHQQRSMGALPDTWLGITGIPAGLARWDAFPDRRFFYTILATRSRGRCALHCVRLCGVPRGSPPF
jgi:hypothetical protein